MRPRRTVSWNQCTTSRADVWERVDPAAMTNSARRRRSLHTRALRWVRDVCADGVPVHRVLLVALTMRSDDPELAKGAVEKTFKELRDLVARGSRGRAGGAPAARARLWPGRASWEKPPGTSTLRTRNRRDGVSAVVRQRALGPFLEGGLASGPGGVADVLPGGTALAEALHGNQDRPIQVGAQLEQVAQLLGVSVVNALAGRSDDPAHEVNVLADVGVPVRAHHGVKATLTADRRQGQPDNDGRLRYFWWPEFQKRGALHYHAVLVNPPFEHERDARHWFDSHWRGLDGQDLAGIHTWVEWRSGDWFKTHAGDYVLKDVRKVAGKWYEQEYDRMPKGWRTCSSSQLVFSVREHQLHENRAWTMCTSSVGASWHARRLEIWVERVDWHIPARAGCRLFERKRYARRGITPHVVDTHGRGHLAGAATPGAFEAPGVLPASADLSASTTGCSQNGCSRSLDDAAVRSLIRKRAPHGGGRQMASNRGPF